MPTIVTQSKNRTSKGGRSISPITIVCILALAVVAFLAIRSQFGETESSTSTTVQSGVQPTKPNTNTSSDGGNTAKGFEQKQAKTDAPVVSAVTEEKPPFETATTEQPSSQSPERPKPIKAAIVIEKIFDNDVENQLEALSTPAKRFKYAPKTRLTDEQIMEYLRRPVEIYEDDNEAIVAAKERTAAMKTEALKYIEAGGSYRDFIREMVAVSNNEAEMISEVRREKIRLLKEEGIEAASSYLEEANARLVEAGLKPIPITIMDTNTAVNAAAKREARKE